MPRHQNVRVFCVDCNGRGLLWLGGPDYAECPNCEGKGWFPMVEERTPTPSKIFLPTGSIRSNMAGPLLVSRKV